MSKGIRLDSLVRNIPHLFRGMPHFVERMLREIPAEAEVADELASAFRDSYVETVSTFDEVRSRGYSHRLPESERFVRLLSDVLVPSESFSYTDVPSDLMQNLEAGNTTILAANHPSAFDGAAIVQLVEDIDPTLYDRMIVISNAKHMTKVKGTLHNGLNRIEVYPDRYFARCKDERKLAEMRGQNIRALRDLTQLVREDGRLIVLFPEGRVDNKEKVLPGAYDIFKVVYNHSPDHGTFLPAYITGSEDITPYPLFFYPFLARLIPSAVNVRVGEGISLDSLLGDARYTSTKKQIFVDDVMAEITQLRAKPKPSKENMWGVVRDTSDGQESRRYRPLATKQARENVRKVAVASALPTLGDEVISHPLLLDALRAAFPESDIEFASAHSELYNHLSLPARVVGYRDLQDVDLLVYADPLKRARTLPQAEISVNLAPSSLIMQMLLRKIKDRNIFQKIRELTQYDDGQRSGLHVHPLVNGTDYFIYDAVLASVYDVGLDPQTPRSVLRLDGDAEQLRSEVFQRHRIQKAESYSIVNPFNRKKLWTGFYDTVSNLAESGRTVIMPDGGPKNKKKMQLVKPVLESLAESYPNVYCCGFGLSELPVVLSGADQFVSVDTSLVHLAVALGTPTVGIYLDNVRGHRWTPRFVAGNQFRAVYTSDFDAVTYDQIQPRLEVLAGAKNG